MRLSLSGQWGNADDMPAQCGVNLDYCLYFFLYFFRNVYCIKKPVSNGSLILVMDTVVDPDIELLGWVPRIYGRRPTISNGPLGRFLIYRHTYTSSYSNHTLVLVSVKHELT